MGLFLDAQRFTFGIELNYSVPLRIVYGVSKDGGAGGSRSRFLEALRESVTIKNIVAQYQGAGGSCQKVLTDEKCLRQAIRRRLYCITQVDSPLMAVAEEFLVARHIRRR